MGQRDGALCPVCEQPIRLVDLGSVRGIRVVLLAGVEFQRAYREEGLVGREAFFVGVQDRCEFGEFRGRGGHAEGSAGVSLLFIGA